jgi:hypothetical protein
MVVQKNDPDAWRDIKLSFRKVPAVLVGDHVRGPTKAPVTVIEYSDYLCPYSRQLHSNLRKLLSENSRISWVFRNRPLESILRDSIWKPFRFRMEPLIYPELSFVLVV